MVSLKQCPRNVTGLEHRGLFNETNEINFDVCFIWIQNYTFIEFRIFAKVNHLLLDGHWNGFPLLIYLPRKSSLNLTDAINNFILKTICYKF